ncbi:MAG: glutamate formimidoyltransferase [Planctomycetes bacterium]|nr:glutamate formimidoyltransferase [Planctomycetota bacterium]
MPRLIECVPNFSEGRDMAVIKQITDVIQSVDGVKLLDVDPGKATNRTVVTFVGEPEPVIEAAVRAGRKAAELIDMTNHTGEHPRFGAIDVCPLIPIAGVTMDECVTWARQLGQRLGDEAGLTVYLYEYAASKPDRKNLAVVRAGEYEGLSQKLANPEWKPDFGPPKFNAKSGATAVGARDFLVAYNVNLNTTSTRRANAIAYDIREKGRVKTVDGKPDSKPLLDDKGEQVWIPGSLKCVKAIGWFIEEYGVAQISINLTNLDVTPIHVAFDETCKKADERGVRVTGSEIVGLVPLAAMLDAGRHFLRKQQRSTGVGDAELIKIAIKSLGLNDLSPFKPEEKIIEFAMAKDAKAKRLIDLTIEGFTDLTASEAPAPGGGSVAALSGALGAALATMVANLSSHKRGWDERWEEFSRHAETGKKHWTRLVQLVDEDTDAFNAIMTAFGLPKSNDAEKAARKAAVQSATRRAIETPLEVMHEALASMAVIRAMAETGMDASISDAGVATLCARTAVIGAHLNVRINAKGLDDKIAASQFLAKAAEIEVKAVVAESEILTIVLKKM